MTKSLGLRAAILSVVLFIAVCIAWQIAVTPPAPTGPALDPEYAKLMGIATQGAQSAMPGPLDVAQKLWDNLKSPFYDNGPNDKGLGLQLLYSIGRVAIGYGFAVLVAVPIGFLIGMSPLAYRALDPFIQVLKPISPLAWMPLALYTIKDSNLSAIFVIFICSVWPMLLNTAFGEPTVAVDTHIFRVANRTGLAKGATPLAVEKGLLKHVPSPFLRDCHHWLILHGRYVCKARKPECWRCPIADLCEFRGKTPAPKA
mgnify:CR=1 FL=1